MAALLLDLLNGPDPLLALVGATDAPDKFGHHIFAHLQRKGYRVVPVNPHRTTVAGQVCYARLADLPARPDIITLVIPPAATAIVVRECQALGWRNVWLQPGADSPAVLRYLEENGFNYLANRCIMVESRSRVNGDPPGR
jgi:uncharacterized protein